MQSVVPIASPLNEVWMLPTILLLLLSRLRRVDLKMGHVGHHNLSEVVYNP